MGGTVLYHVDPTYSELLEENMVDLSAPLDDFERECNRKPSPIRRWEERVDVDDEVEEHDEEFDASQANFGRRTGNYT